MYCKSCQKEREVFELYDGKYFCARCRKEIDFGKFSKTAADDGDFTLSEILFHEAIASSSRSVRDRERARKRATAQKAKAVALCKRAALNGHPQALLRLAYYYETGSAGIDPVTSFKLACNFYRRIWSYDKGAGAGVTEEQLSELKRIAAERHLALLRNIPAGIPAHEARRYVYADLKKEIARHVAAVNEPPKTSADIARAGNVEALNDLLKAAMRHGKSPLFGLVCLTGEEFSEWADAPAPYDKSGRSDAAYFSNLKGLTLCLISSEEARRITDTFISSNVRNEACVTLCFFTNRNRKTAGCAKRLAKNDFEQLKRLSEHAVRLGMLTYVFYPDDVLYFRNTPLESVGHATVNLVDYVMNEEV